VIAYSLIYRSMEAPADYVGFVVLGGAMIAFWSNVMWNMSSQLYWEKEQGNLALYIMAPTSMIAVLAGMALGGLLGTAIRAAVIVTLGVVLFHVPLAVSSWPALIAIFLLAMIALYGLGMMLASLFLLMNREAWHLVHLAEDPVYLLSGFFFPIRSFPFWISTAASAIPLTLGLDAMRQVTFRSGPSTGFLPLAAEIPILAGLALVNVIVAARLLAHMEGLAIREGRLTESRR